MTPRNRMVILKPGDDLFNALSMLATHNVNQLPVVVDNRIEGMLTREDIMKWLSLFGNIGISDAQSTFPHTPRKAN